MFCSISTLISVRYQVSSQNGCPASDLILTNLKVILNTLLEYLRTDAPESLRLLLTFHLYVCI